jgi:hypothetical protein
LLAARGDQTFAPSETAMTRDEELLNEIIQRRGYIVVRAQRSYHIGERLPVALKSVDDLRYLETDVHWYIVGPSDANDEHGQVILMEQLTGRHVSTEHPWSGDKFYRVLSD